MHALRGFKVGTASGGAQNVLTLKRESGHPTLKKESRHTTIRRGSRCLTSRRALAPTTTTRVLSLSGTSKAYRTLCLVWSHIFMM